MVAVDTAEILFTQGTGKVFCLNYHPINRAEPIMLKKIPYYAVLHCTKNLPIMLNKCPYYAQIMLIECDPCSENQSSGLF